MLARFRPAREEDLDRLLDIHVGAFPDPRGREARRRNFTSNPLGRLSDLRVAVIDERVVGHAFLFPLEAHFGGERVPVGGIASVGVAPEARGRGVGTALVEHLCSAAQARGDALTLLYAFRQGFYDRLGYAPSRPMRRLRVHPRAITWPVELRVRPAGGGDREALQACWEAQGRRGAGSLVRSPQHWVARLADERRTWLVVESASGVEGYVAWTLEQPEAHAHAALVVDEMAARTGAAWRSLWALAGAQRDQVHEIRALVADDDPVASALVDPDRARPGGAEVEHALGEIVAGPMIRLTGLAQALEARGWPAEGSLALEVDGSRHTLTAAEGRARLGPTSAEPDLETDSRALAAVAFGGVPVAHAEALGWLRARDDEALARAARLLALPPFFSFDAF